MGIPSPAFFRFLACGAFLLGCQGPDGTESRPASAAPAAVPLPGPPDTLALLELHLATPALDSVVAAESERLDSLCGVPRGAACSARHRRTLLLPLAPFEDDDGAPVGSLAAHVHMPDHGWLLADFVYLPGVPAHTPAEAMPLPDDAVPVLDPGDWGYGLHFAVRAWREGPPLRVRLPGIGSEAGAWLVVDGGVGGWVMDPGETVWLVEAGVPGLPEGAYRILRVEGGRVELRGEIPSDMPCEPDLPPDPEDPGRHAIPLSAFFDADGRARLRPAYPRGC